MQSRDSEIVSCVQQILDQLRRVMEGKDEQLLWALAAILARGHILLEDIPGVGKTTIAHKGELYAAKVLAAAAAELMENPGVLVQARKEFDITAAEGYDCPIGPEVVPSAQ